MAGWRLIKSETFTLERSKALPFAAKHAGLPKAPTERELDPKRVERLCNILKNGLALPFCWALVKYQGQTTRMNGQTSSTAIVEVGPENPASLTFHLDTYEADDRGAMVELFRQFDQRWSSRTQADIAGAYQGLQPTIASCNRRLTKLAAEAISWCLRTVEGSDAPTGDNVYDILHNDLYLPFISWADGIVNGRKELFKKEVLAAMFKTHDVSESGATKFWREVSFGPDYFSDDMAPGAVLIGELSRSFEDRDFREKEFEQPAFYYKKAVKAWNAFCAGQRIASLKVAKGKGWPDVSRYGEQEEAA